MTSNNTCKKRKTSLLTDLQKKKIIEMVQHQQKTRQRKTIRWAAIQAEFPSHGVPQIKAAWNEHLRFQANRQRRLENIGRRIAQANEEKEQMKKEVEKSAAELEEMQAIASHLAEEVSASKAKLAETETALQGVKKQVDAKDKEVAVIASELKRAAQDGQAELQKKLDMEKQSSKELFEATRELASQVEALKKKIIVISQEAELHKRFRQARDCFVAIEEMARKEASALGIDADSSSRAIKKVWLDILNSRDIESYTVGSVLKELQRWLDKRNDAIHRPGGVERQVNDELFADYENLYNTLESMLKKRLKRGY